MTSRPNIVWFRDDLRLSDHPALHAASRIGQHRQRLNRP
jgi:deoxyribodipyrimidine photo-lyase